MKISLYIIAASTFIALVGAFVYTLDLGSYRLESLNISLPITLWIVLPLIILFLLSIVYMLFYGMTNYFQIKKWKKDSNTLEDALYWSLVNEPKEQKYVMSEIKESAVLLNKASLDSSDNIEGLSPRLSKALKIIQKIKSGEYVDLKEEKMSKVFKVGNPILVKNRLNHLESDEKFVETVMRASGEYSKTVQQEALEVFAQKENFEKARKYTKIFDVKNFLVMLHRVNQEDDLGLNKEILSEFIENLKLSCEDFVKIAEVTKKYFKPDENLTLFKTYQKEDDKAQNAYLYLLFEYELMDQVGIFLEEHEENEFVKFRAFYQLKKNHSKYKLEDVIDISSVCQNTKFL
ncbi:MAG: hypothetical protein DSZ09_04330 [Sulfurovum sp.]|nr:MAG: hypothetical protein DSZ08_08350 [Sulfurovum sp.]RUM70495.1 MAG: hypothetical protein DSZ09_04330 [Sulfurovum sp.]RUM75315.1 MAG: hypothetical protein DSZ12_03905 [Sulfurovum sp.]